MNALPAFDLAPNRDVTVLGKVYRSKEDVTYFGPYIVVDCSTSDLKSNVEKAAQEKKPMQQEAAKPSLEEILEYGRKHAVRVIRKKAGRVPQYMREDMQQEVAIRLMRHYPEMDPTKGIKSYVQTHTRGAVLDFIRSGNGLEESGGSEKKKVDAEPVDGVVPESAPDRIVPRLRHRVEVTNDKGNQLSVEETAGMFGIFAQTDDEHALKCNWPLLARLAGPDRDVHLVCKILLGFDQEEIAAQFEKGITRERLSQRIYEFFARLELEKANKDSRQIIFALGLTERFETPDRDNGFGWDLQPFDLIDSESFEKAFQHYEPSFAGIRDEKLKRSDIFGKYKVPLKHDVVPTFDKNGDEIVEHQSAFQLDI